MNNVSEPFDDFSKLLEEGRPVLSLEMLHASKRWVCWKFVERNGKPSKIPFDANLVVNGEWRGARANESATWATRNVADAAAAKLLRSGASGGIGIQLGKVVEREDTFLGGIDLDSCFDEGGALQPWAAEIIDRFQTYAEVSPSGNGIKLIFSYDQRTAAQLPTKDDGTPKHRLSWSRGSHHEIGLDLSNRYYAVTGKIWAGTTALRHVDHALINWVVSDAGPRFRAQVVGVESGSSRDESGSGYGLRFLVEQARDGASKAEALAALEADEGVAGDWARRSPKRQTERAWKRATEISGANRDWAAEFDELDDHPGAPAIDRVTERLNEKHAAVMVQGRTLIATKLHGGGVGYGTSNDLNVFYANDQVPAGKNKTEPASMRWLKSPGRRTYSDGVTFAPGGAPSTMLNLWEGWAVQPDSTGSCRLFLNHVREIVCRGNDDHEAYVLGWLAHLVQRADEKPGVALVLKGSKGAGKDTLAEYVTKLIGRRHVPTVAASEHIVGKFNARFETALMLHVQEGSWAGDRKAEGVLKYLVTSDRVEIERKGIDSISLPSVMRLFISANADWVVPASNDERRWAVFNVSDVRCGDLPYFDALRAEMDGDGPAALLHYLMNYDLAGFSVRRAPATEGLLDQKVASLHGIAKWWFEFLCAPEPDRVWGEGDWITGTWVVPREELRGLYLTWMKERRFENEVLATAQFGQRLREFVPELGQTRPRADGARQYRYVIPSLSSCRAQFDKWIGGAISWTAHQ